MTAMPKNWYEDRLKALTGQLEKARERMNAERRVYIEAEALYTESQSLVNELNTVIYGLRRELAALEKSEGGKDE